jgi:hypothetical protein
VLLVQPPRRAIALLRQHFGGSLHIARAQVQERPLRDGVPNLAFCLGYTNASWTLRADLVARFVCRLLRYMRRYRLASCRPRRGAHAIAPRPLLNLSAGYVQRAAEVLPQQGDRSPWRLHQQHLREWFSLRLGRLALDALEFRSTAAPAIPSAAAGPAAAGGAS